MLQEIKTPEQTMTKPLTKQLLNKLEWYKAEIVQRIKSTYEVKQPNKIRAVSSNIDLVSSNMRTSTLG